MLPSAGGGLTVKAIERKEGLDCMRSARLGPVEMEGPEWLDREKAREDPEAGKERGLKGGGKQITLDPEQFARAHMRPGAGRS